MPFKINRECIACAACVDDCPNKAISEGPGIYVIDATRCTECVGYNEKPKCISICPTDAILPDPDHQETHEQLLAKKDRVAATLKQLGLIK